MEPDPGRQPARSPKKAHKNFSKILKIPGGPSRIPRVSGLGDFAALCQHTKPRHDHLRDGKVRYRGSLWPR